MRPPVTVCASASAIIALVACGDFPSADTPTGGEPVAIYSTICFHEESGDLLGDKIVILRQEDGRTYALVQTAEGVLDDPKVAEVTSVGDKGIRFTLDIHGRRSTFSGELTEDYILGRYDTEIHSVSGDRTLRLPRQPNGRYVMPC